MQSVFGEVREYGVLYAREALVLSVSIGFVEFRSTSTARRSAKIEM